MKFVNRLILVVVVSAIIGTAFLGLLYYSSGPFWLNSAEQILGEGVDLELIVEYDDRDGRSFGNEGEWLYVYSLSGEAPAEDLRDFPKYPIYRDDGEVSFKWKSLSELSKRERFVLDDCLKSSAEQWEDFSHDDAGLLTIYEALKSPSSHSNIMICALYKMPWRDSDVVTDLEMYILHEDLNLLIKVGWWT